MASFIAQYVDIEQSNRTILEGKEIDIFIPSLNIGFEFNGLYWHSSKSGKSRKYHQEKTDLAKEKGVRLIHIWSDEWRNKREWVESFIKNIIGKSKRIGARKTKISILPTKEAKQFHEDYHLQGHRDGKHYALTHDSEVVALATIAKNSRGELELARWTVKHGVTVQGGLSKVMKHINMPVVSFCDTAKYDGAGYLASGFKLEGVSQPSYWYTDGIKRFNRVGFQKHKLKAKGWEGDTEKEMAANNGFYQIGGCSQLKFMFDQS